MISIDNFLAFMDDNLIDYKYNGLDSLEIDNFSSITNIREKSIVWLRSYREDVVQFLNGQKDMLLVTTAEVADLCENINIIQVEKPKMVFFELVKAFFIPRKEAAISKMSDVETKKIGKNVSIGNFCTICAEVEIGDNVIIGNNVQIVCPTVIGDNCVISSGVVIGSNGFGYYENVHGKNSLVPHIGGVVIGNNVDIGANTCIDRGTIEDTIIGDYSKIDNLCHIAHNVVIESNVFVIAQSMIGGSVLLKNESYIAPGSIIMNQITIGESSLVGMGAVVTKDVENEKVVAGIPAKVIREREKSDKE